MRQQLSGPTVYRDARTDGVIDSKERRVRVSFSSEIPYRRTSWFDDPWIEVLGHKKEEIDLSRFAGGAGAVLYGHNSWERGQHVGVIERAWVENGKGFAEVRLSMRKDVEDLWRDIVDGIVRNVSVGYQILERVLTKKNEKAPSEYRVTRWLPMELSFVPIPADATVGVGRSAGDARKFTITEIPEGTMEVEATPNPGTDESPEQRATRAERERVQAITGIVSRSKAPGQIATRAIAAGTSIEVVREQIIEHFAARDVAHRPGGSDLPAGVTVDAFEGPRDNFDRAAQDAILLRAGCADDKPHPAARDLSRMTVVDLMRAYLAQKGERTNYLTHSQVVTRAMTTSDFPLVLTNAVGAAVRRGYETEPQSHRAWVREELVPDFKILQRPILGSAPALLSVLEMGEYQDGPMGEDSASYQVAKFGRIVSVSWELLVNDQLSAFIRVQPAMGQAARRLEADVVYALLLENAGAGHTMQDGVTLFHLATHANVTADGAMDLATLGLARTLLRKQQAVGGGYLSLVPKYLIVPAELETDAEVAIAAATRHVNFTAASGVTTGVGEAATPNWIANLEIVVEPRLPETAYYLAADSDQIDTVEVGKLDDDGGVPVLQEEREFRKDAMRWKIRHVVGAKPLDWRGLVKVPIAS